VMSLKQMRSIKTIKSVMDVNEVCDYLGVSLQTVYGWVWRKKIPHVKMGRLLRFRLQDIEAWLEAKAVKDADKAC